MVLKPGSHGTRRVDSKNRFIINSMHPKITFVRHRIEGLHGPILAILSPEEFKGQRYRQQLAILDLDKSGLMYDEAKRDRQKRVRIPRQIIPSTHWENHDKNVELRKIGGIDYVFAATTPEERQKDIEMYTQMLQKKPRKAPRVESEEKAHIHIPTLSDDPQVLQEQLERMRHGR